MSTIKINLSFTPDHARELLELVERAGDSPLALPIDRVLAYHIKTQLIDAGVIPEDELDEDRFVQQVGKELQEEGKLLTKASQFLPFEGESQYTGV
jgi:hypothetical protein